jgi:hypothetical protein
MRGGLSTPGWVMVGLAFAWLAATATGPFLYVVRRYIRRPPDYPGVGDRLWALLGLPWLATALLQSILACDVRDAIVWFTLMTGLAGASLLSVVEVWSTWVVVPPEQAEQAEAGSWTNRVGLVLAIAWPIQCGLGLIVLG